MFSKSKRFPEGRLFQKSTQKKTFFNNNHNSSIIPFPPRVYFAVGKEYIPGPGEYEVFVDDIVKHKRYGFISQTSRFPENLGKLLLYLFFFLFHQLNTLYIHPIRRVVSERNV
jgi:hypothetical protein